MVELWILSGAILLALWVDGREVTAQCKLCLKRQSSHITRIKSHYDKCVNQTRTNQPQQQGTECPVPDPKSIIMETSPSQLHKCPATPQFGPAPPPKHQADLNNYVFRTPAGIKYDLDEWCPVYALCTSRLLEMPLTQNGWINIQKDMVSATSEVSRGKGFLADATVRCSIPKTAETIKPCLRIPKPIWREPIDGTYALLPMIMSKL